MSSTVAAVDLPRVEQRGRVTQARVVLSEWTKLHSLRSTRWSLLIATVLAIGLPALFAAVTSSHHGGLAGPGGAAGGAGLRRGRASLRAALLALPG